MNQTDVQESLDKSKTKLTSEVEGIEEKMEAVKSQMSDLKTHLYAKFGNAINLEADEE
jgi:prefoldin subunit 4